MASSGRSAQKRMTTTIRSSGVRRAKSREERVALDERLDGSRPAGSIAASIGMNLTRSAAGDDHDSR